LARTSSKEWDFSLTFRGLFLLGVPLSPILVPPCGAPLFCCTLIVSHFKGFVKRLFHSSVMGLEPLVLAARLQPHLLTITIYHFCIEKSTLIQQLFDKYLDVIHLNTRYLRKDIGQQTKQPRKENENLTQYTINNQNAFV
jgi:hypothetical protein